MIATINKTMEQNYYNQSSKCLTDTTSLLYYSLICAKQWTTVVPQSKKPLPYCLQTCVRFERETICFVNIGQSEH